MKAYTAKTEFTTNVTCDRCGKSMAVDRSGQRVVGTEGSSFTVGFGWGSRYDMDVRGYDLCDDCCDLLDAWMKARSEVK